MSKRQYVVSLSTIESEYMAATHASKEAVWLQRLCSGIGFVHKGIRLYCDSQSAIFLERNPAYHAKTKHIDVQYQFVRDMVEDKKVLLEKGVLIFYFLNLCKVLNPKLFCIICILKVILLIMILDSSQLC